MDYNERLRLSLTENELAEMAAKEEEFREGVEKRRDEMWSQVEANHPYKASVVLGDPRDKNRAPEPLTEEQSQALLEKLRLITGSSQ